METIWQKYVKKKIEQFKNSEEFAVLSETLTEFYGENGWDYEFIPNEKLWFRNFRKFNYYGNWDAYLAYIKYEMPFTKIENNLIDKIFFNVTIHFPEIKIKNRNNLEHTIKDLYVKVCFPLGNKNALVKLEGLRTTFSRIEVDKGYIHSHLPGGVSNEFKTFCLGSSEMSGCFQKEFISKNKTDIYQFLFTLQNYLEYESIEGVPHIRMENCQNLSGLNTISNNDLRDLLKIKPPLVINNELKITNKEEIEEFFTDKTPFLSTKIDGKYYSLATIYLEESIENLEISQFKFKNQLINFKIHNYAKQSNPKKYPHPYITKRIIAYWENRILKAYIRSNNTREQNTIDNTLKSVKPNEVFV